jgi:hypothetical protein
MKRYAVAMLALACASCAMAKNRPEYTDGRIVQMDSVPCAVRGQDAASQPLSCQEYTIETDLVTYHVRPADAKHASLISIGGAAHFRLVKDRFVLESPDGSGKEREFVVVSMKPREVAQVRFKGTY